VCASELLEVALVTVIAAVLRPGGALRDSRGPRDRDKRNTLQYFFAIKTDLVLKSEI